MATALIAISQLLLAMAFLEVGSGLQGLLIPIRAHLAGFSGLMIGFLGTAYYAGFVLGCLALPRQLQRVGHIRIFSALAALAGSAFLVHALIVSPVVWLVLRALVGCCFAGLYMSVESWLNDRASRENRGRLLSAYMVVTWLSVVAGKMLYGVLDPAGLAPFAVVSIGISLAVIPVALTSASAPEPTPEVRLRIRELYRLSPVALVGCLGIGATNGAFWTMAPLYAELRGLTPLQIGTFMSAAVIGGAFAQWPLGLWSDRVDRRRVTAGVCAVAGIAGLLLALPPAAESGRLEPVAAFVFGASALPLYSLFIAHANDSATSEVFVSVSSGLLMMFGLGAIAGPLAASAVMHAFGRGGGIFAFTASVHCLLAIYTLARIRRRAPVPATAKGPFVPVPRTTQAAFTMDPRRSGSGGESGSPESL
jgi:MFS family permease